MALLWGAHSVQSANVRSYEEMVTVAETMVKQGVFAREGDSVVVVAGVPFGQAGSTNNLRVARIRGNMMS